MDDNDNSHRGAAPNMYEHTIVDSAFKHYRANTARLAFTAVLLVKPGNFFTGSNSFGNENKVQL
jgi:hypothetical protein